VALQVLPAAEVDRLIAEGVLLQAAPETVATGSAVRTA
jgi:hypothetical protein